MTLSLEAFLLPYPALLGLLKSWRDTGEAQPETESYPL